MSHVAWSVCVFVCFLGTWVCCAKTAEPIEMPFGSWLMWVQIPPREGALLREACTDPFWCMSVLHPPWVSVPAQHTQLSWGVTGWWCGLLPNYYGQLPWLGSVYCCLRALTLLVERQTVKNLCKVFPHVLFKTNGERKWQRQPVRQVRLENGCKNGYDCLVCVSVFLKCVLLHSQTRQINKAMSTRGTSRPLLTLSYHWLSLLVSLAYVWTHTLSLLHILE